MKSKMALLAAAAAAFACCAATPRIEQGELKYDVLTHKMSIDYVLVDSAAIVTFDLQTNVVENGETTTKWATIGAENYQSISGNFNRVVKDVGVKKTISWTPYEDWPQKVKAGQLRAVVTAWSTNSPPDYCVVNINRLDTKAGTGIENRVRYYLSEKHLPYGGLDNSMYWTSNMVMRRVHAAGRTFRMGSPWTELGGRGNYNNRSPNEMSVVVTFTKDYWMAIFPMTCKQTYYAFNSTGNHSNGDKGPMTGHSWANFRIGLSGSDNSSYNSTDYDWPNNTATPHLIGENSYFGKMKRTLGWSSTSRRKLSGSSHAAPEPTPCTTTGRRISSRWPRTTYTWQSSAGSRRTVPPCSLSWAFRQIPGASTTCTGTCMNSASTTIQRRQPPIRRAAATTSVRLGIM